MLEVGPRIKRTSFSSSILLLVLFLFSIVTAPERIAGQSLERDKEVLLDLKSHLQKKNHVNQGLYSQWREADGSPCNWPGITCENGRVTGINLRDSSINGELYANFSGLTELARLDLSMNTISDNIQPDLNKCKNLKYLNLSRNILTGELNLSGLTNLGVLDLTQNRLNGSIASNFPGICTNLVALNISLNKFTGHIGSYFDACPKLKYVDLSSNQFTGNIGFRVSRILEFSSSENNLTGNIAADTFQTGCVLEVFELAQNSLTGELPDTIANCKNLSFLNLWGNGLTGAIPPAIGALSALEAAFLGNNGFDRVIPEVLLNCSNLEFLDLSKNRFGGDIQPIFGKLKQIRFLSLQGNNYTGGLNSSGILKLQRLTKLDLSYNKLSGDLPIALASMKNLKYLILAYNGFTGKILPEFGTMARLQALDLSYNDLTGEIPPSLGNLTSLLWLMLADNSLTGSIPPEIGNCQSLMWLNLANNRLSGPIPPEIKGIGRNPYPTFEANRRDDWVASGSGECLAMRRWLPASYPPFSFVYTIMTTKLCRSTWDSLLKGMGTFPICVKSPAPSHSLTISGYLQLSGNQFSGEISPEIGKMGNFSLIHLNHNNLTGRLPPEISYLPLVVLNVSHNGLFGAIPPEIGELSCLQNLDISYNNFSAELPMSFNGLTTLDNFNASYNPLLSGVIPSIGQLSTFENDSFIGNPLIVFDRDNRNRITHQILKVEKKLETNSRMRVLYVALCFCAAFVIIGVISLFLCSGFRSAVTYPDDLLSIDKESKSVLRDHLSHATSFNLSMSSNPTSVVEVFCQGNVGFTYADIITATTNFAETAVVGRGGFGKVYLAVLPGGRKVAVKKLMREGPEGEREFLAEMEVLRRGLGSSSAGSPHPNLVPLYGWCLCSAEKLLVYEFMEGGSLEDVIADWEKLNPSNRVEVAVGVARALVFLHDICQPAVVHRDVKASNVLLDGNGKARVTDFGLARTVRPGESHVSTMVAGTVGYVAPEYAQMWKATTKGDVYSFGVLAMELATGRRAVEGGVEECLVDWARRGRGLEGMGREMRELLRVGKWCAAEKPQERPDMMEVLRVLMGFGELTVVEAR